MAPQAGDTALIAPALDLVFKMLDDALSYRFGYEDQLLRQIIDTNLSRLGEAKGVRSSSSSTGPPGGLFGNLSRLRAAAPWRRMLEARVA